MKDYYAARAAEYDQVYLKPERQADLRAVEQWLPTVFAGKTVLEVACGTGYWTQFIAPVSAGLVGVDASAETLQIARSRLSGLAVTLVAGDAYELPIGERRFQSAFAGFWWSHVPKSQQRRFLDGLHAALQPGATVVLLDNRYVEGSNIPLSESDAEGNTYQRRTLADGSVHRVLKNFPSRRELLAIAPGATVREWPYYWALTYQLPFSP
ncbi:MAG: class I SAM-dependent methyltransferase [Burkholderiales bacterium]|nr:class I SAM-dependent methyltransferase [Burkholderiales bacterium]